MAKVTITGWQTGFRKVACTKTLRALPGFDLAMAKEITDSVLEGETQVIELGSLLEAEAVAVRLRNLGAVVRVDTAL